jgi:hypothetical protein
MRLVSNVEIRRSRSAKKGGTKMKKWILVLVVVFSVIMLGSALASEGNGPAGPAPNSGDCEPNEIGFDSPNGPNGSDDGRGPVPNSGDGIPDGSGF